MNTEKVDIIIVTWNGLAYTKRCVGSIKKHTKNVDYRFIFVDNASSDGTVEYLRQIPNSVLIANDENKGFAKAMNQSFRKVSSKYTVWLNNDTIVTSNWLRKLIDHLEMYENAGAIGPVSNGTGIVQKIEGLEADGNYEIEEFGQKISKEFKNSVIEYHRIAGFCILMKSEIITKIGMLDENFNHGGYDDDDYCRRIRDGGYKILIAEDVFVFHKSGASFSSVKDPDFDLRFLMPLGKRKLLRKWQNNYYKIQKNATNETPLVSIIMTTMNRKKIISNAIKSVIEQTYNNWELIIINDGGEDIQEVITSFNESRIKYVNFEKNKGKSYAVNKGIENSKGEIIAYLDDDDRWYNDFLELCVHELQKNKRRQFVYTDYVKVECIIDKELKEQFPIKKIVCENQTSRTFFVKEMNFIPNFSMVHRKELFDIVGEYDTSLKYYEDWDIIRRFSYVTPFYHIPEIGGEYWIDISNEGRNANALRDKNFLKTIDYIKSKDSILRNDILENLDKADNMTSKKNLKNALKIYTDILQKDQFYYPAVEGVCDRLFTLQKYEQAEEYFKKMLALNPYKYSTYIRFAENEIYQNKHLEAKSLLEKALLIADDRHCYYLLIKCYKKLGMVKTAKFLERRLSLVVENIHLKDVEDLLLKLYNENRFFRQIMIIGYKILKRVTKN